MPDVQTEKKQNATSKILVHTAKNTLLIVSTPHIEMGIRMKTNFVEQGPGNRGEAHLTDMPMLSRQFVTQTIGMDLMSQ